MAKKSCFVLFNETSLLSFYRSSFSDFASKHGKDERFRGVEKMRERENMFQDYVSDLKRKEKEDKASQKEKVCVVLVEGKIYPKCQWKNCVLQQIVSPSTTR